MNLRSAFLFACIAIPAVAENWPQFLGPSGTGVAPDTAKPPVEFGPAKRMLWKTPAGVGHGSPAVWGDKVYLLSADAATKKLTTSAYDLKTGKVAWSHTLEVPALEEVHKVSNHATATPFVDGERVYSYFGSYGVVAYTLDGKPAWNAPLPIVKTTFGSGGSPLVAGDVVLLTRDQVPGSEVLALSRKDGSVAWKVPLSERSNAQSAAHSTPVVWQDQALIHTMRQLIAFNLKDGSRKWWIDIPTAGTSTPVVAGDKVFLGAWAIIASDEVFKPLPAFDAVLEKGDANKDGKIARAEVPDDIFLFSRPDTAGVPGASMKITEQFDRMDANKDGFLESGEWEPMRKNLASIVSGPKHGTMAIQPGGEGDMTAKAILWKEPTGVPEVTSPLYYRGHLYMINNGGVVSCFNAKDGKMLYRARLGAGGPYYASPVGADGKVYFSSAEGVVTVIEDADALKVLSRNDLAEPIYATPAIIGKTLLVRTTANLYRFGQ